MRRKPLENLEFHISLQIFYIIKFDIIVIKFYIFI